MGTPCFHVTGKPDAMVPAQSYEAASARRSLLLAVSRPWQPDRTRWPRSGLNDVAPAAGRPRR